MTRVWSAYQLAVFEDARSGEGHTVVEAVPGSGKTTTGTEMLRHIPSGLSVWMGAFNKEIADALIGRVPPGTRTSTFHSFAFGATTRALGRLKVDRDRMYHVLDDYFESRGIEVSGEWAGALCKAVSLAKSTLRVDRVGRGPSARHVRDRRAVQDQRGEHQATRSGSTSVSRPRSSSSSPRS